MMATMKRVLFVAGIFLLIQAEAGKASSLGQLLKAHHLFRELIYSEKYAENSIPKTIRQVLRSFRKIPEHMSDNPKKMFCSTDSRGRLGYLRITMPAEHNLDMEL